MGSYCGDVVLFCNGLDCMYFDFAASFQSAVAGSSVSGQELCGSSALLLRRGWTMMIAQEKVQLVEMMSSFLSRHWRSGSSQGSLML